MQPVVKKCRIDLCDGTSDTVTDVPSLREVEAREGATLAGISLGAGHQGTKELIRVISFLVTILC